MCLSYKSLNCKNFFFLWKHENSVFLFLFHQAIKLFHLIWGVFLHLEMKR